MTNVTEELEKAWNKVTNEQKQHEPSSDLTNLISDANHVINAVQPHIKEVSKLLKTLETSVKRVKAKQDMNDAYYNNTAWRAEIVLATAKKLAAQLADLRKAVSNDSQKNKTGTNLEHYY